jgi:hypothetical protein
MKNVHLLPTDKPSRLFIDIDDNKLKITQPIGGEYMNNQHIYITNDSEIKEGDWVNSEARNTLFKVKSKSITSTGTILIEDDVIMTLEINEVDCKKIIITTDEYLIADGIQKIDDEFLEWFVNNSSCESVDVENHYRVKSGTIEEHKQGLAGYEYYEYKIIIPQAEPKQIILKDPNTCDYYKEVGCIKDVCDCYTIITKQETIEEVAEKFYEDNIDESNIPREHYECEIQDLMVGFAYKWQQERMYSEEDLKEAFKGGGKMSWTDINQETQEPYYYDFKEWFENFNKN